MPNAPEKSTQNSRETKTSVHNIEQVEFYKNFFRITFDNIINIADKEEDDGEDEYNHGSLFDGLDSICMNDADENASTSRDTKEAKKEEVKEEKDYVSNNCADSIVCTYAITNELRGS